MCFAPLIDAANILYKKELTYVFRSILLYYKYIINISI